MVLRWFIAFVTVGLLAVPPPAGAARVRARFPAVAIAGRAVSVPGRVSGAPLVRLERRVHGRWASAGGGRRFPLRWRAPRSAGVARMRVAAVRRGRVVATTPARRVAVSATRVLLTSRVEAASPGHLRYAGRLAVRPGQFVAADVGSQTPYGLLGRVVAVRQERDATALSLAPARLTDVVPAGRVTIEPRLALRAAAATSRRFASAFTCRSGVASLDGSLALRLIPTFRLDWSLDGVDSVEAAATLRGDAELEARVGAGASCSLDETVARWDAPALRFALGPIPVVIVPRTELKVAGEAQADAAVATGVHGRVDATAGLRWDGSPHPIGAFRHALSYTPPSGRVSGAVGARVIPSITFLLYGQAGPRFDLSTGLQLDADAGADPWWTLSTPVELSAALELPQVADVSIPQLTVFSKTFPLGHADREPQTAVPGQQPGTGAERARISWDTAATDVDLHVWDESGHHAWFRDPAGIPGGELSEDDRFGFGPEYFADSAGGRTLTFGLCYFDDSAAGATHVSVQLTDPDGTPHESTRTLAREGDHVLVGSSPAGAGFVPPDGWCRP
jgi:hypothetical protein